MPVFNYRARDTAGKLVKGAIEAAAREEVAVKLRRMGYAPVKITEVIGGLKLEEISRGFVRVSRELCVFPNPHQHSSTWDPIQSGR